MNKWLLIVFTLLISSFHCLAQSKSAPHFEDFPVAELYRGKPARLNLRSHPQAKRFRTMLKETVKEGANFAGHYAVNYWGCGTDCLRIGIVDLRTGKAYVSPFYASVGIAFHANSQLLIVAPPEQIKEIYEEVVPEYFYPKYYKWAGNRLVLIYPESDKGSEKEPYWK